MQRLFFITFLAAASLLTTTAAHSQSKNKWSFDNSIPGVHIANTTNAAKAVVGIYCTIALDGCEAYLAPNLGCEEGVNTPMMVNSPVGALAVTGKCTKLGTTRILVIDEFDDIISAFESGGEIGFAMPMDGGQFTVVRFSTAGATQAIKAARTRPAASEAPTKLKSIETL